MAKHVVDFVTVDITKGPRSYKAKLYYDPPYPYPTLPPDRPLRELTGKTEKEVLAKAKAWIASRTPKKLLGNCGVCRNGVELKQLDIEGQPYKVQLHCDACGVVLYRGKQRLTWA